MQVVPLIPVPSQTLSISLNGQPCKIHAYQRTTGYYLDLYVNDEIIVGGVICHDRNLLVRSSYLGFSGDLAFVDTQGTEDPDSSALGTRWILDYLLPDDLIPPAPTSALWVPTTPTPTPTPVPTPTPTPTPVPTPTPTPVPTPVPVLPGVPTGVSIT